MTCRVVVAVVVVAVVVVVVKEITHVSTSLYFVEEFDESLLTSIAPFSGRGSSSSAVVNGIDVAALRAMPLPLRAMRLKRA